MSEKAKLLAGFMRKKNTRKQKSIILRSKELHLEIIGFKRELNTQKIKDKRKRKSNVIVTMFSCRGI